MRVRIAFVVGLAVVALGAVGAAYAADQMENFGNGTYSPGEIAAGSHYDTCQYWQRSISEARMYKNATRLGKVILINNNGNWIATAEDSAATTVLYTPGFYIAVPKKGTVKNTSSYSYYAGGYIFGDNYYCT